MYGEIRPSSDIVLEDNSFLAQENLFKDRKFCPTSPFFSGCIRIKSE